MSAGGTALLCALFLGRSPELRDVQPPGAQRGTEVAVALSGQRLDGALELLFDARGIECLGFDSVTPERVIARLCIAADCELGEHRLRLRTAGGLSELRTFWVGPFPDLEEAEPNDALDQAQAITLPVTVHGVIQNEDVDLYRVRAEAGQRIGVEVEAMRLGRGLLDAAVSILDERRFEIASCDDCALLLQDPTLSVIAPSSGDYYVSVRHSAYEGGGDQHYRLHVGAFPRPTAVYPPGGVVNQTMDFEFVGDAAGTFSQTETLGASPSNRFPLYPRLGDMSAPSPQWVRVHTIESVEETESGDQSDAATPVPGEVPLAFHGRLDPPGDRDSFLFHGQKGQALFLRLLSRDLRSPMDGVMSVRAAGSDQVLASNDDSGARTDPRFEFTVPEDGDYVVRVEEHLRRGGPSFVYRGEISIRGASLRLQLPRFGLDSQDRQTVSVPRGGRAATVFKIQRSNFSGDVVVTTDGLPVGVRDPEVTVPAALDTFPLCWEAEPDAELRGAMLRPRGNCESASVRGGYSQTYELLLGPPNRTVFYDTSSSQLALAVVEAAPLDLEVRVPSVPIVRTGSSSLRVEIHRKEGFTAEVVLRLLWTPPGVSAAATVNVAADQSFVDYPIEAGADAMLGTWPMLVQAEFEAADGPLLLCAAPVPLEVAEPFVRVQLEMAALEQGSRGGLLAKLEVLRPFDGAARAELIGLPAKTTAEICEVAAAETEFVFPVQVEADGPVGKHAGLFCRVQVPWNGEWIVQAVGGGGVLRIDPPAAPEAVAAAAPQNTAPEATLPNADPATPPAKPLSRLEQLRLEAAEKKNGSDSPPGGSS